MAENRGSNLHANSQILDAENFDSRRHGSTIQKRLKGAASKCCILALIAIGIVAFFLIASLFNQNCALHQQLNGMNASFQKMEATNAKLQIQLDGTIVEAMRVDGWNHHRTQLKISADGLSATHVANDSIPSTVHSNYPWRMAGTEGYRINWTPLPYIVTYFEVNILASHNISLGFCHEKFALNGSWIGNANDSIGLSDTAGATINGQLVNFENASTYGWFRGGDVVGTGLFYFPADESFHYFATLNGTLLGSIKLPQLFMNVELYPAVSLYYPGDSVRANFGAKMWLFKDILALK